MSAVNIRTVALAVALGALLGGCRQDMHDQPKLIPLRSSDFFADGQGSRPALDDTVARGHLEEDEQFYTGKVGGHLAETFPMAVTPAVMERGQERYNIYCSPCHDRTGSGAGMVVRRGLRPPPSFHGERLRKIPVGHFFDVITHGFGAMASYASRIPPADRWAIAAYIRALQLSQDARLEDLPPEERARLEALPPGVDAPPPAPEPKTGNHEEGHEHG